MDDIYQMPGARFFSWATRIFAYGGVMQQRLHEDQQAVVTELARRPAESPREQDSLAKLMVHNPGVFEVSRNGG